MTENDNNTRFRALQLSSLAAGTGYQRPYYHTPNPVKVGSSALEVMTDLKFVPVASVSADADVESASQLMIARGVRMLLVVDDGHDVLGLITARDLLGDRLAEVMQRRGVGQPEILVREVMTSGKAVEVLEFDDVLQARVGDVIVTLKGSGRQHALVVERDVMSGKPGVRGIFSASQIARQLGIAIPGSDLSRTFAEIDAVIVAALGLVAEG